MDRIEIRAPDDFHVHLRQGEAMAAFARDARDAGFARVLAMPNTSPPILDAPALERYRAEIRAAAPGLGPLMSFALRPSLRGEEIRALKAAGALVAKWYPANATTNSEGGIAVPESVWPVLEELQGAGIALSLHAEDPAAPVLEREAAFLPLVRRIAADFPRLKIVVEHMSSARAAELVLEGPENLAGGLTAHHLLFTLDDLMGGALDPQLHCKPCLKTASDREALRHAALSGHPRIFFGSDSAPHPRGRKEGAHAASGSYTMPVALPLLAGFFADAGRPEALEDFVSRRGAEFYGLPLNAGGIALERAEWTVPEEMHGVVPVMAGRKLAWRLAGCP